MTSLKMADRRTMFECEECKKWFFSMDVFTRHPCVLQIAQSSPSSQTATSARNGKDNSVVDEYAYAGIDLSQDSTNKEIDDQVKVQEQQEQSLLWCRQSTLLLISEYKDRQERIETGKIRKNKAFEEISKELNKAGYRFNPEQCSGRIKTITRAYKQVKDHNAKSGNDRKTYEYEAELNELFSTRPNIRPKFVLSTKQDAADESSKDEKKEEQGKRKNSDTDSEGNNSGGKVRKTQASAVISYLETVTKSQEERHEREQVKKDERHKERMGLFRDLIDALKEKK